MGGRSSVSGLSVTVFGASGFTGRYLVSKLGQIGSRIVIPYRGNETDVNHLRTMADLGQIYPLRFDLRDKNSVHEMVKDSNVVVNLIAQDRNSLNFKMDQVNEEGASRIAEVCKEAGVQRLIHVSSLLAKTDSPSLFQQSKWKGEQAVRKILPGNSIVVRPSSLFGHEDRLMNVIGLFSAVPFGYPVVNHGKAIRHPLYVGDFTEALVRLCQSDSRFDGKTFDLLGPEAYTWRQLIEYFGKHTLRQHRILNVPPLLMLAYSRLFPEWRRPVYTRSTVRELLVDEMRTAGHLGFEELGLRELQTLDDLSLGFIRGFRPVFAYPRPLQN